MADNCGLKTVKASATVKVGSITISTPHIQSISVNKTRGQLVSTASVSFLIQGGFQDIGAGAPMAIYFYSTVVWVGFAKRINIAPSPTCAGEMLIRIQGEDVLFRLENKNYTRRQKLAGLGPLAMISSLYKRTFVGFDDPPSRHDISTGSSPFDVFTHTVNIREQTMFATGYDNVSGQLHPVTKVSDIITNHGTQAGGGGFILHDHTSLDLTGDHAGGPARSVFSIK
jgi:hypothetical protein